MADKMPASTQAGVTRTSSHLPSIYGNGSLELVWQNGQILVHGGSSSATRNTTSCMRNDEDACIAKSARLNTLHSLLDFPVQSNDQNSCQFLQFSKTKSSIKPKDGCANLRPITTIGNGYSCTPSTQQCSPSAPLKKPIIDSSQTPITNSKKEDLGKVNFSKALRLSRFLKSTYQGNSATLHTNNKVLPSVEQFKAKKVGKVAAAATSSKALDHSAVIESCKGSHGFTGLKGQTPQEPLPDEYSEAVGHKNALHGSHAQYYNQTSSSAGLRAKGITGNNSCNEPLLESSSVCSLGASNNINLFSRKHEDTDDSTYSSDNDEESEDVMKEKPAWDGTRTRVKRSRDAEIHNLNERKRRDEINNKMRVLKELIPNCNKVDKASMLDDAIQYLKTLKFQLQIMSMGTGLCMPLMMLPTAAHHMMNAPRLPQLMGFRPGTNIPCSLPQFPIPPLLGTTDNRVGMFGFPDQVPPMPMSHAPFMPMFGNPTQSLLATSTNLAENLASAQFTNNSYLNGQAQYATKQAPDQGTN